MATKVDHKAAGVLLLPGHEVGQWRLLNPMSAEEVTAPAGTMLSFDAGGWAYLCSGSQRQWVKELLPAPVMKMGDGRIYSLDVEKKAAAWRKDMLMKFTDYFPKFEMQGEEQTLCARIYQGFRLGMRVYWDTRCFQAI